MTSRTLRTALALALAAAASSARAGLTASGDAGLSFDRFDAWSSGGHQGTSSWFFNGDLTLDAALFDPGDLDVTGTGSYQGYRTALGGPASDGFNYQLSATALANTPFDLGASVARQTIDFTSSQSAGQTGSSRVDVVAANAGVHEAGLPAVEARFQNQEIVNRSLGLAPARTNLSILDAHAGQAVDGLNYSIDYQTDWSGGDYAETNFRNHLVTIQTGIQLDPTLQAVGAVGYYLRQPTLESPFDPRIENASTSATLLWAPSTTTNASLAYVYSDVLFQTPGSPYRQSIAQTLALNVVEQLADGWAYNLGATGADGIDRLGTTSGSSSSESLGGGLTWNRTLSGTAYTAMVSGAAGLYQPEGGASASAGGASGSYSTSASFGASRPLGTWNGTATLNVTYGNDIYASAGSQLLYGLSLGANGYPLGWIFNGILNSSIARLQSPVFGTTENRNLVLNANALRNGWALSVNGGYTDNIASVLVPAAATGTGTGTAATVIPSVFNTETSFAMLAVTAPVVASVSLTANGRYIQTASPGQPTTWERDLGLAVGYTYGAFNLSLYDQLTNGGVAGGAGGNVNLLMVSVSRSFGR